MGWTLKIDDVCDYRIIHEDSPMSRRYCCFDLEIEGSVASVFPGTQLEDGDSAVLTQALQEGILLTLLNDEREADPLTEVRLGA